MREQKAWINVCISNHAFLSTFLTLDSSCRQKKAFRSLFFSLTSSATNDRDFERIRGNLDKICRYSVDVQWSLVMKRAQNKKQLELCKQNYNRLI